jgi:hypothetical protein
VHELLTGEASCPHTFYRAGGSAQRDRSPTGPGIFTGRTPVVLPEFAIAVLAPRRAAMRENSNDAVFPTRNGTWHQVNNVERRWRQIRTDTGLEWRLNLRLRICREPHGARGWPASRSGITHAGRCRTRRGSEDVHVGSVVRLAPGARVVTLMS